MINLISCSPKLKSRVTKSLPALDKTELVVVLDIYDDQIIAAEKLGEIKALDNGFSENCTFFENIQNLKTLARKHGANLIKLTKHKKANNFSSCERLWANIYYVENVKRFENEIIWSQDRKLTWADFKGKPDQKVYPEAVAVTNSGFGFESGINLFKDDNVFVQAVFYNHGSWVLQEGRTDYVLKHEQIHFDITEIYARMLRKALTDANVTSNNYSKALSIFNDIKMKWEERQEYYDYQTKHGTKLETQEKWEAIIEIELAKFDLYKTN